MNIYSVDEASISITQRALDNEVWRRVWRPHPARNAQKTPHTL